MNDNVLNDDEKKNQSIPTFLWGDAASLMATLDAIAREGVAVLIKVDGMRDRAIYTVVVSGKKLGDSFYRKDGDDILVLLREAVDFYRAEVGSE